MPYTARSTHLPFARRVHAVTMTVVAALALAACQDGATPTQPAIGPTDALGASSAAVVPITSLRDEYIVVLRDGSEDVAQSASRLVEAQAGTLRRTYSSALRGFSARLSPQAAAALAANPMVEYVEPDRQFTLAGTQSGASWGLDRIDQAALPLDGNFTYPNSGSGVNIYIIDSGIRRTHVEFGGRAVAAYSAIADGYGPDGCHWHGTHIAGVAGGTTYGAAKGATLHSVRAYDCSGVGTTSSILAAIDWVATNRALPAVANMSIQGAYSASINSAVQNVIGRGVTFVAAAGNNAGQSACNYSPASVPEAITVAAIGGNDAQATYSNVGSCVDLYAPGTQIYGPTNQSDTYVALFSGTSQAAAFTSGAAAIYLASNPSASPAQVAQAIVSGATSGAVVGASAGTPNLLLRVTGGGSTTPPPPPPSGNAAPVASFTATCAKANCTFDASGSTDDSQIAQYAWAFGDGTTATSTSPRITKTYSTRTNITVTVRLTVTDDLGLTGTTTKSVFIKVKGK